MTFRARSLPSSWAAACFLLASACSPTFQSPAEGGTPWREARSAHFVVATDLDAGDAQRAVQEFEEFRAALEAIAFPSSEQPRGVLRVTLFSSPSEYEEIAPPQTSGFFRSSVGEPTIVLSMAERERLPVQLKHELVHRYVAFHIPNAPVWLNEGMADFYSTLRVSAHEAFLGDAPDPLYLALQPGTDVRFANEIVELASFARPFAELRRLTPHEFYADDLPVGLVRHARRIANYATSWAAVRLLALGDGTTQRQFSLYLSLLKSGEVSPGEAWQRALSETEPAIARALEAGLRAPELLTGKIHFSRPPAARVEQRELPAAAVHELWARLRPWASPEQRARARRDIDKALELAPADGEAQVMLGRWLLAAGRRSEAKAAFERAARRDPRDPRYLYALAAFYFELDEQGALDAREQSELARLVTALEPIATSAEQLNFVAWYWARAQAAERGLPFARRALQADSSCAACYDTLAALLSQTGAVREASRAEQVALNLGEEQRDEMSERLGVYRASLAELERATKTDEARPRTDYRVPALPPGCERAQARELVPPPYPELARRNEVEGVVEVRFVVNEQGTVEELVVLTGPAVLADAVVASVRRWTFVPARCGERNVASVRVARFPFRLASDTSPR